MTNHNNAAQAANENPLSDEYVNAIIQRHGYDSPESVIAQLHQWIGLHGDEDTVTLLMYEAHKVLSQLRAPVADEPPSGTRWPVLRAMARNYTAGTHTWDALDAEACEQAAEEIRHLRAALASAPVAGEPFMYGIMGPDGKAHFEEFCVSGDRDELQAEVVDHLNRDNPEDGSYSVVALFRDAAPQASTEARPSLDAVDLARAGMALHAPGAPEHTVCAELVRLADALKQPQADKAAAPCTCPSGDGSLRHPCPAHPQGKAAAVEEGDAHG
ncbi:hypothetical protein ACOTF1_24715 [Achromobacter ruhlandii]|uniref:hypothetical protein n=1 Tax=Achromobacter ruhlandii TaxID=72557 RepID=UPI003B9D7C35